MVKPVTQWMNTKTTKHTVVGSCLLYQIVIACADAGTAWTLAIQDLSTPNPLMVVPPCALTVPTDGKPIIIFFEKPLPMKDGIDIVTAGTTAGPGGVTVWLIIDDGQ
jgi:hypothetical protein